MAERVRPEKNHEIDSADSEKHLKSQVLFCVAAC